MPTTSTTSTVLTNSANPATYHYLDLVAQLTLAQMRQRKAQRQGQLHTNAG